MAIRKAKITKAQNALIKAGMPAALTKSAWRLLDLDKPLDEQIIALAEDDPELFEPAEDDSEDDTPAPVDKVARLRGEGNPYVYRRPATARPSTASKAAQEAAAHLRPKDNPPPTRQRWEPVRDINPGHKPLTREPSASAKALAARLKGN